jgi:formate/nitrite transporter FocA (FNT family)
MSGRDPDEIWQASVEEGERRLKRRPGGMLATGFIGGADVMLGVLALCSVSGALSVALPEQIAHVGGSLVFGFGFAFLVVGRGELFTENFLVPIAGALRGRGSWGALLFLWVMTAAANLVAIVIFAWILSRAGLVPPETLEAAGTAADTLNERTMPIAFLSAVIAGTTMTLLTWLTHAVELDISRIVIALLIGFVLAAPTLNHAVVSVGELSFGLFAKTTDASWFDLLQNFPVAVAGNLVGGLGFVTLARLFQVRGEPDVADARESDG